MKYLLPPTETGSNGPQISVCTSSNGLGALHDLPLGKGLLCCLPIMHTSHTYSAFSILGNPCTMLDVDNTLSPLKLRCPR